MTKFLSMCDAPVDGSAIVVDDVALGLVVVRWRDGAWHTGFASEIDGDPIVSEAPIRWIKVE